MKQITIKEIEDIVKDKRVAIVGSAPSVLDNEPGLIDSYDYVVRVNNYKLSDNAGKKTDIHYSFYGRSIRKSKDQLMQDGVRICMCKCPDGIPFKSEWHFNNKKMLGCDFRYIYRMRKDFWFCPVYVPNIQHYMVFFNLLNKHVPTTGFACIAEFNLMRLKELYITGFDFFSSGVHNVNEKWIPGDPNDPVGHVPDRELSWLQRWSKTNKAIKLDKHLQEMLCDQKVQPLSVLIKD